MSPAADGRSLAASERGPAAALPPLRRARSLRTRATLVIAAAIIVPCLLLSVLGVYTYYRSWHNGASVYAATEGSHDLELASEVASVSKLPASVTPSERAVLITAIITAVADNHPHGGYATTMVDLPNEGLPVWVVRSVQRRGYAVGSGTGPLAPRRIVEYAADPWNSFGNLDLYVAWRVGPSVFYFAPSTQSIFAPSGDHIAPPVRRLAPLALIGGGIVAALVIFGAIAISRSVVGPVRRVAEASARLAEGRGGEPVPPGGPREIRELADSFNDMNRKLTKAQEAEQAFLLSVSHELKTPLTSIRGYAEALDDGALSSGEAAAVIGAESGRLERLVGDLLDLARMRKSAFTVRHEPVDLSEVADEVAARYQPTAGEAGLTLAVQSRAASFAVGDHDRVIQVISNLVENAIRSTPTGGTVSITAAAGTVAVADTGLGLTSDDLPRAFERFYLYSRHRADRAVGTGLGLAIVKELAEAMGGRVTVTSPVGVGTTFVVALPAASSPEPAADAPEPETATEVGHEQ